MSSSLGEQIASIQSENDVVEKEFDDYLKRKHAKAQSGIAWLIVIAFVVFIVAIFCFIFFNIGPVEGCVPSDTVTCASKWKAPAEFLSGIVSSVMLPIVTLVLGYYFGTEQKSK